MACAGCQARREWIAKWRKVAYERARKVVGAEDRRTPKYEPAGRARKGVE